MSEPRPGVVLDRDGTLIDFVRDEELGVVTPAFHPRHVRLLPGVVEGLAALRDAGFALAIATNQPGAAKGQITSGAIEGVMTALVSSLAERGIPIDAVEVCRHHPSGGPGGEPELIRGCDCRKPAPGMLTALVGRLGLDASRSWMVGDSRADMLAARAAGLRAGLLFEVGRCELCPLRAADGSPSGLLAAGVPVDAAAPRLDALAREIVRRTP